MRKAALGIVLLVIFGFLLLWIGVEREKSQEISGGSLHPVIVDGETGFIDGTGEVVLPPQFDQARDFSEGLAAVRIGDRWGYIDETGKRVIPLLYERVQDFTEGRNITDSLIKALEDWLYTKRLEKLSKELSKNPVKFDDGFSAEGIRKLSNRS